MPLHCWDSAYIHTHQSCRSGSWALHPLTSALCSASRQKYTISRQLEKLRQPKKQAGNQSAGLKPLQRHVLETRGWILSQAQHQHSPRCPGVLGHQSPLWMAGKGSKQHGHASKPPPPPLLAGAPQHRHASKAPPLFPGVTGGSQVGCAPGSSSSFTGRCQVHPPAHEQRRRGEGESATAASSNLTDLKIKN